MQGGLRAAPTSASSSKKPKVAVLGESSSPSGFGNCKRGFSTYITEAGLGILGLRQDQSLAGTGAAGGIGQPLALLLKGSKLVGELSLYDIVGTEGVAADLSHIDSSVKVALLYLTLPHCPVSNSGACPHVRLEILEQEVVMVPVQDTLGVHVGVQHLSNIIICLSACPESDVWLPWTPTTPH